MGNELPKPFPPDVERRSSGDRRYPVAHAYPERVVIDFPPTQGPGVRSAKRLGKPRSTFGIATAQPFGKPPASVREQHTSEVEEDQAHR